MSHSRLTSEGLKRASARGIKLGFANPVVGAAARTKGMKAMKDKGEATFYRLTPAIKEAFENGCVFNSEVADYLNSRKIRPARGNLWSKYSIASYVRKFKENR